MHLSGSRMVAAALALALLFLAARGNPMPGRAKIVRPAVALGAFLLLMAAAFGLSGPRLVATRGWLTMTNGLVDVGGYRLRIDCQGTGGPTVFMDCGLSQPMTTWGSVPEEVSQFTHVCVYDRAGVGESDPAPVPRTSQQIVDDMHRLLANARVPAPFVLVGHSFGGLNVRLYAAKHPEDVVGMVLVDASHEDQIARLAELQPPAQREVYLRHERGGNGERVDIEASSAQVRAAPPLPVVPLVVICCDPRQSTPGDLSRQVHDELQADLQRLEPDGKLVVAEGSGHFVPLDRPDLVVAAIREVVDATRRQMLSRSRTSVGQRP